MSRLTHEEDFRSAIKRIIDLCQKSPERHKGDFICGRVLEVAQAALFNADAADQKLKDMTEPTSAFKVMGDHFGLIHR